MSKMIGVQVWRFFALTLVSQQICWALLEADGYNYGDSCDCVDVAPGPPFYTCEQQAGWGKCDRGWMKNGNYCAKTCGRCTCEPELSSEASIVLTPDAFELQISANGAEYFAESARPDERQYYVEDVQDSCTCDDIPTSAFESCEDQRRWGKCERGWMKAPRASAPNGFCATTCGRCTCEVAVPVEVSIDTISEDGCACTDISPIGSTFDCRTQSRFGKCEAAWMLDTREDPNGYCQISCGRCTCRPHEEDPCDVLRPTGDSVSILRVSSVAVSQVESATAESVSSAIAQVQDGSVDTVSAAQSSAESIGLAVADAVASVSISGCTQGENAVATGFGSAESESFARAVGSAVAESFASAGNSQVALNAATVEEVVKTGLAFAEASVTISGDAQVNIDSTTVSSAIACVLSESLSRAYAKLEDAIVSSAASVQECPPELINQLTGIVTEEQLFTSGPSASRASAPTPTPVPSPSPSPTVCRDVRPSGFSRSCQFIAFSDRCDQVQPGECERSCGKCQV
eukprot:TRINITY_DN28532_c0_g1_i4.p1 TRINITY_DN28532_c0_g1~~TRINITY_DN28532_c0_g1_i4.p1  ORF type:complete len:517 (+),score=75.33 TRINITY_DN28532_c0_g1_i4:186-1736(+)